jgi:ankyrin repeat protein
MFPSRMMFDALYAQDADLVEHALADGADPNIIDGLRITPLQAVCAGSRPCVRTIQALLTAGANVNCGNGDSTISGRTPLMAIVKKQMRYIPADVIDAIVRLLVAAGASLEQSWDDVDSTSMDVLLEYGAAPTSFRGEEAQQDAHARLVVMRASTNALLLELAESELDMYVPLGVASLVTDGCMAATS